jgi:Domain of unknown function (DUF1918)
MHAQVGDWLVVQGSSDERQTRQAEILAVHSADGGPPYQVRWLDTGHEALVFPGPDAHVVSAAEQAEIDRVATERAARMQAAIRANKD